MRCPRCGTNLPPQARQCSNCGLLFSPPASATPSRPRGTTSGQWFMPDEPDDRSAQRQNRPLEGSGQWMMDLPTQDGSASQNLMSVGLPNIGPPSRPWQGNSRPRIGAGVALQQGRLRVIAPYGPTRPLVPPPLGGLNQWVAIDGARLGDRVVLLELPLGQMVQGEASQLREAMLFRLQSLGTQSSLPRLLGAFAEQGNHFLVFEYFDGEFLSDRVQRLGALPEFLVLGYGSQLAAALLATDAQAPGLLHGLITPDTVLISADGRGARLTTWSPYALAHALGVELAGPKPSISGYSPPEVQRGQDDQRSDLYSLGATLHFAITGKDAAARGAAIFPPARQDNPLVSLPADAVLAKAVRLLPTQRYQSAQEMSTDLERAAQGIAPMGEEHNAVETITPTSNTQNLYFGIAGVLTILLVGILIFVVVVRPSTTPIRVAGVSVPPTATINPTVAALAAKGEGLSSGALIFDTSALAAAQSTSATPTVAPTAQTPAGAVAAEVSAAAALRNNDLATAIGNFQQAVDDDPSNAEARIYLANAQIAAKKANVVTLTVAVSFAPDSLANSREVLRGIALAQANLNTSGNLPGTTQVGIAIASVGPQAEAAQALAQGYVQQAGQTDPLHRVGIISWAPYAIDKATNERLVQALGALAQAGIPILAPQTSTDQFPSNPFFFRLSPSDATQGKALANEALKRSYYSATEAVVDTGVVAAGEIGQATYQQLSSQLGGAAAIDTFDSTTGDHGAAALTKAAQNIAFHGSSAICFSGGAASLLLLLKDLFAAGYTQANLPTIYAGPASDTPELLGQGSSDIAQFATQHQTAMLHVHVLTLADSSEWNYLIGNNIATAPPPFFDQFGNTFTPLSESIKFVPDVNAILSYDAVDVMLRALLHSGVWTATTPPRPQDLQKALSQLSNTTPFQGVGGSVVFDAQGHDEQHALVAKEIVYSNVTSAAGTPLLEWKVLDITPNNGAFCETTVGCSAA